VPASLALLVCKFGYLLPAFDIAEAAHQASLDVTDVAKTYFMVGDALRLDWLSDQLKAYPVDNSWEELSRASLRDDLDYLQRNLSISVLQMKASAKGVEGQLKTWLEIFAPILHRWSNTLSSLEATEGVGLIKYSVAIRALLDIAQSCGQFKLLGQPQ
jgi:glutamate dehydrogenase